MQTKPDIRTLLEVSNLGHLEKNFEEEGLEVEMLLRMSEEDIKDTLKELKITKIGESFRLVEQIRKIKRVSPTNPTKEKEHPVIKALTTQKVVEKPQEMKAQRKKPDVVITQKVVEKPKEMETQRKRPDEVTTELELDTNEKPKGSTNMTAGE